MPAMSSPVDDAIRNAIEKARHTDAGCDCDAYCCSHWEALVRPHLDTILRSLVETVQRSQSEIERRDERRKALLEACAAVCERCAHGMPTWSQAVPGSEYIHTWGEGSEVLWPCTAMGIRALLVVEGEPEPKTKDLDPMDMYVPSDPGLPAVLPDEERGK